MADFPFDLIGFDLDGTLVDSSGDLAAAVNRALAAAGRAPLTVDHVRPMIGGGSRVMLRSALLATGGDHDFERLYPLMIDYYAAHIADTTRPFPGVVAALDDLAARGVKLAVVTSKIEARSVDLLRRLDLLDRFACVIGGDTVAAMKPDPAPVVEMLRRCGGKRRAAFVGDSAHDVGAAHAAGLPCLLFAPTETTASGADATFGHYDVLVVALERLSAAGAPVRSSPVPAPHRP
ncbi:HAD-IA family hydrolase [Sphingomonas sp.]|jgi:phosphoglycolate phosphatase|uniref:HAD-IA family hydrolase n=1 Tax=Sphingomonas sp. TaxID=28214 RepID=UPI002E33D3AD|nr:HAD-IA family hydrolase [Sphingomonas sp.]HEX4694796.1 HAD-IA family hydrolase [Sphingomonas sp.]